MLQAMLQNTLEQSVLAIGAYLVWATLLPSHLLSAVPCCSTLFALGRALFFKGYESGAGSRAVGFVLTFYPSVLMLGGATVLHLLGSARR